jgi:hypothetical protein
VKHSPTRPASWFMPFVGAICVAAGGCRDPRDPNTTWISGYVTCDGQPIAAGDVVFEPKNASIAPAACKIKDGTFQMKVPKGDHIVRLYAFRDMPLPPEKRPKTQPEWLPPIVSETVQYLPDRYNSSTTVEAQVEKSGDTFTFDLDSKPDPKK